MTTEYSVNVNDWHESQWNHIGRDLMYEYYLEDEETKKECEENNWELEDIACERADDHYPMMLYAYPLGFEPDDEKIIEVCTRTNCTVVENDLTGDFFLALSGGGMDLSQDIALAYLIIQGWIPTALAYNVSTQPCLSVSEEDYLAIMKAIKTQLENQIGYYQRHIREIDSRIASMKVTA